MNVLVLVGPTASGKTLVSVHLARLLGGEIISADSRQVYRNLDIGTAKPPPTILKKIRHHCINERDPDQEFSAGEFGILGRKRIEEIFSRSKQPIVVGGSGLYVQSLIDGLFEGPAANQEVRRRLEERVVKEGTEALLKELRRVDPESAARADATKPRRIIRALEVYELTGKPLSKHHVEAAVSVSFGSSIYGLSWDREALYRRIEGRCDAMLKEGLLREVEALEGRGYAPSLNALNTVGYAEAFAYRRGELSFEEMVRLFKQNSRRYAKRQLTWFRRDKRIEWIAMDSERKPKDIALEIARKFRD